MGEKGTIETSLVPARPRGKNTVGKRGRMGKRKTEGIDQAAPGTKERRGEAVASRLKRKGGGGAAAQAGERGGGMREEEEASLETEERGVSLGRGGGDSL